MIPIIKKEFRTYFTSMTGYFFLGVLVFISALLYSLICILGQDPNYQAVLDNLSMMFLIIIPTLTMRLFAEEARQKTDQLLYTSPITILQIVFGKYLAAFFLFLLGMAITMVFPMLLGNYGQVPYMLISCAFLGYILLGACFISVGLFISVLTDNQIISAVATFAALLFLSLVDSISNSMPADRVSSIIFVCIIVALIAFVVFDSTKNIFAGIITCVLGLVIVFVLFFINNLLFDGIIVKFLNWFSVFGRFTNFYKGVLSLSDVFYYISFSAAFIYLTINVIEKRRWR